MKNNLARSERNPSISSVELIDSKTKTVISLMTRREVLRSAGTTHYNELVIPFNLPSYIRWASPDGIVSIRFKPKLDNLFMAVLLTH
jgi:hypothetical protein